MPDRTDNSTKCILARGCDPVMSMRAAQAIPPLIGNPEYVPTTTDDEFFAQLSARKWSVIFFAPGACRFDAAQRPIPGANLDTTGWTLDDYRSEVRKHQGDAIPIVETLDEQQTLSLLRDALASSPDGA